MISVDYSMLDSLLQSRGISRRKLAIQTGLSVDSLSASFRRHSKMKIDSLWKIADCLSVSAKSLIDRSEYATDEEYQTDCEAVENGRSNHEIMVEDTQILEILHLLRNLNSSGLRRVFSLVELVNEAPKYKKTSSEVIADQARKEADYLQMEREADYAEIAADLEAERGAYQEELPYWQEHE